MKLAGLFAEFHKLSPSLSYECDEREARILWANEQLKKRKAPVKSWNDLRPGEIKFLIRAAREQSGSGPRYRAMKIAELACELWGGQWDDFLHTRIGERFHVRDLRALSPADARAMIEELKSRIARGKTTIAQDPLSSPAVLPSESPAPSPESRSL